MSQEKLTHDEELEIVNNYLSALSAEKDEEALNILRQIPLAPQVANVIKNSAGTEFLKSLNFNLSEVEKTYGHKWLEN